ncbi:dynein light chain Tctex-type protein 2B [Austrofundulus limnaeus]|uniref:Dynein light chain Tctex-type protein 2B n=1 Tax=Austrofundulus limnaeus TaxID=52670 RepID=A0A2I4AHV4_AUSLI|nr:PREDICTED: tctex1 domain-containing protein 2-like [Austrofundulus limnaeus]
MFVCDHTAPSHSMGGSDAYRIRPNHQDKFKPAIVKECIGEIVREHLSGVQYEQEKVKEMSNSLADHIKDKVKTLGFDRYKFVVQVVIGEQRGQGVKISSRCLWDADTDSYAEDVFMNDSLFCLVAVFGSYYY